MKRMAAANTARSSTEFTPIRTNQPDTKPLPAEYINLLYASKVPMKVAASPFGFNQRLQGRTYPRNPSTVCPSHFASWLTK
jgi:hypothetical protein